ncbi:quercetin 2,3-dioxygenase [Alkalilimnicola ehrlichii]|uniref:Quercetin 2,3-dioxygenase n=1 Tax=Alkalilimnicola ehrlichii TaxID=351052 RepID=A0A3E0WHV9_9GAMM|nr:pirin family protein [Alkalilimnicola ehrlichii]RFA24715.1 quercetin 2,3-dioxygenase [Alkalilimnicola ehrlichii]RFA31813.1 quercetin 2,3-dioxygenase [Alkalilimnicola ehrlichii]
MSERRIERVLLGQPASDGAGVKLNRVFGPSHGLDPFLMLDEFNSNQADDYIAGFPAHPHRGFETVTYMLEGEMLHEDHLGNRGRLVPGAVQWMTAGRGIIHSEMPQQEEGRMRGFQLWLNLPANEKMKPAAYRDIPPEDIPVQTVAGGDVKVVAGAFAAGEGNQVDGAVVGVTTDPLYLDVRLEPGASLSVPVASDYTVLMYCYEGQLQVADTAVEQSRLAVLSKGDRVNLDAGSEGGRALLLAAKPLQEPVAHYGPFVMNTPEEVEQALRDFRGGRLTG